MRRNSLSLVVLLISFLALFNFSWGQCPEEPYDLGECDTLHIVPWGTDTCFITCNYTGACDTICINNPGEQFPRFLFVPILVTHDSNTFWWESESKWTQDSIAAFVVPIEFTRSNQSAYCSLSGYWNENAMNLYDPRFARSMWRHFQPNELDSNRMASLAAQFQGLEWSTIILDMTSDSSWFFFGSDSVFTPPHMWISALPTNPSNRRWWEGDRILLATMTFVVEDTMHVCMDSMFWPPSSKFSFTRHDAQVYQPRHNLPQCLWAGPPLMVTSPNGGETWSGGDVHNITWIPEGFDGDVKIEYSTNGGTDWISIDDDTDNDGTYSWPVPSTPSTECRVRVSDAADGDPSDMSDDDFTIELPNQPPDVEGITGESIAEGDTFAWIPLDDYVTDPDDHDSLMIWTHWGETELLVDITDRVATVSVPNPNWNGSEAIWFKACDPEGLCDSNQAAFTVTAVNDTPEVADIPDQTITEGQDFAAISLDNYVTDVDDHDSVMIWTHWGETELTVDITDRVATISVPNYDWNGSETIWFKACDPGGACDSNEAIFTVTAENDTPEVADIPDQTITEGQDFATINLDDYVTDVDDHDSVMTWTHWGEADLLVDITDRIATISVPSPDWDGSENIWFKACDPGGLCDSNEAIFTVLESDFTIDVTPETVAVVRGDSGEYDIVLTSINGFASDCTLEVSGHPDGSTPTFDPSVVVPTGSSILTIEIPDTTTSDTFDLTITATEVDKGIVRSDTVVLIVLLPTWSFMVDASPDTQVVTKGNPTTYDVTIIPNVGFSAACTLYLVEDSLPAGATADFAPNPILPNETSTLTINTLVTSPTGEYHLPIIAVPNEKQADTTYVTLIVEEATDVEDEGEGPNVPDRFALFQNQPNPFNPETKISYNLPQGCEVSLTIYDILGRRVKTLFEGYQNAGIHSLLWNGRDDEGRQLSSGVYFYRLQAGELNQTRKMALVK
jgi:hypothetical protein